jgi:type II secretory pathway pseudopilin PulG
MPSIFVSIVSWLSGGVLEKLLDAYSKRQDTNAQIAVETIKAELETRKLQKDVLIIEQGWWLTAAIRPLIVYPFILHIGAIALDSTFTFGWGIAKLPSPYDQLEQAIILSYFLTRPFEKFGRGVLDYLRNR